MTASVIICAHNHLNDLTIPCLSAVLHGTLHPYQLILIDDGSGDNTSQYFQTIPNAVTHRNSRRAGVSVSRNIGFSLSDGDPIVFLDNDITVPQGWLTIIAEEIQKPLVGIAAAIPSNEIARLKAPLSSDMLLDFNQVGGGSTGISRLCHNVVGFFDEELGSAHQDTDYCWRAKLAGFRVVSTPRLVVAHKVSGTRRDLSDAPRRKATRYLKRKYRNYQAAFRVNELYPLP